MVLAHWQHKLVILVTVQKGDSNNHVDPHTPHSAESSDQKSSWRIVSFLSFLFSRNWVVVPEWNFASWSCASDDYNPTQTSMCFCSFVKHRICHIHPLNIMVQVSVHIGQGRLRQEDACVLSVLLVARSSLPSIVWGLKPGSFEQNLCPVVFHFLHESCCPQAVLERKWLHRAPRPALLTLLPPLPDTQPVLPVPLSNRPNQSARWGLRGSWILRLGGMVQK